MAVLVDDHGLVLVGGGRAGFYAFWQVDGCETGHAVGQMIGVTVGVQEEEPLVEGLGLDDAHVRILLDARRLDVGSLACVPGACLPIRVQREDSVAGGDGGDGLCLSRQVCCSLFSELWSRVLGVRLAGLKGMNLALLVHC